MQVPLLLLLLLLLVVAAVNVQWTEAKSHPALDELTTSDSSLSASSQHRHAHSFLSKLSAYRSHLADAAATIFLQAESISRQREAIKMRQRMQAQATAYGRGRGQGRQWNRVRSSGVMDMAPVPDRVALETEALTRAGVEALLEANFAAGDRAGVIAALEQLHGATLTPAQHALLLNDVGVAMEAVEHAAANGESIDPEQLRSGLDAIMRNALIMEHRTLLESDAAAAFGDSVGPDAPRAEDYGEIPQPPTAMNQSASPPPRKKNVVDIDEPVKIERPPPPPPDPKKEATQALKKLESAKNLSPETAAEAVAVVEDRTKIFKEAVKHEKEKALRQMARGEKVDLEKFINNTRAAMDALSKGEMPPTIVIKPDDPLPATGGTNIQRKKTATPEDVADVEASLKGGVDPWTDLPGRSVKAMKPKEKTARDILDAEGWRCPKRCSLHGQCIMDLTTVTKSPSGAANVHPFKCLCDSGYVGDGCQIKLDMYLRWLLTEGLAPFPKCCNVCRGQREVPFSFDDIPTYKNPFSAFEPKCQPFPRVSRYSREDGTLELVKGRRPHPSCSYPLGEIARADPIVALELATDLSAAQKILQGNLLETMDHLSQSMEHVESMTDAQAAAHIAALKDAGNTLSAAGTTAERAIKALAEKMHVSDLTATKLSNVDMDTLWNDAREMPPSMDECCIYCQLDEDPAPLFNNDDPSAAATGPNAILTQDPRFLTPEQERKRRMALRRTEESRAKRSGTTAPDDEACCVVCPYNLREVERLREAAFVRANDLSVPPYNGGDDDIQAEKDRVFLEVFAEVDAVRRSRNTPMPCCPSCPSQFLIAHAFPNTPFTEARTMPNMGPA